VAVTYCTAIKRDLHFVGAVGARNINVSNNASFRQERNNNLLLVGTEGRKRMDIDRLIKVRANKAYFSGH
jgi:hypothetical protein